MEKPKSLPKIAAGSPIGKKPGKFKEFCLDEGVRERAGGRPPKKRPVGSGGFFQEQTRDSKKTL